MRGQEPGGVFRPDTGAGLGSGPVTGFGVMPSADEIAAEFERYLADQDPPDS
jgi:hypothetical protein